MNSREYLRISKGALSKQRFALDIGGSLIKLIYHDKNIKDRMNDYVTLCMEIYPMDNISTVINQIRKLIQAEKTEICEEQSTYSVTGIGCSKFKSLIESSLNIKIQITVEMVSIVDALLLLLKEPYPENKFYPITEQSVQFLDLVSSNSKDFDLKSVRKQEYLKTDDSQFPALILLLGSGVNYIKVDRDGTHTLVSGSGSGGRRLFGLATVLTKFKSFDEILASAKEEQQKFLSDCPTQDMFLYTKRFSEKYSLARPKFDNNDTLTNREISLTLLHTCMRDAVTAAMIIAEAHEVKRIYGIGTLLETQFNRDVMCYQLAELIRANRYFTNSKIRLLFPKHGTYMGAIGAVMNKSASGHSQSRA